jgi:hypothetical protein
MGLLHDVVGAALYPGMTTYSAKTAQRHFTTGAAGDRLR